MTIDDVRNLHELLQSMQVADPDFRVFGADNHKYRLGAPLSETTVTAFEQKYQIVLPSDYRFFLQYAGEGGANRSASRLICAHAGAGPGYGLFPLEEALGDCDPTKPFPFTSSTGVYWVPGMDRWGDEELYPGVLQIGYNGCAFFSFLVVNGPGYGTVWDANLDYLETAEPYPSFTAWYRRWTDRLVETALPLLATERVVEQVEVGMTKARVIEICAAGHSSTDWHHDHRYLRFKHLRTKFEFDANDVLVRIVRLPIF